jgi:hypothetical protein
MMTVRPREAEAPVAHPAKTSSPPKSGRTMVPGVIGGGEATAATGSRLVGDGGAAGRS